MSPLPTVIVIAGATAAGKTALAVELAQLLDTVIISADARQCFREMTIGVAKPSPQELASVHHYFINTHSIRDTVNAAVFESLALKWAEEIFAVHRYLILVGGSGLYINAFCDGLDDIPSPDPALRQNIRDQYALHGIGWLQEKLLALDPDFSRYGEMKNPHRMQRALEVVQQTGQSILSFHRQKENRRGFRVLHFALGVPKETLMSRIDHRVLQMMKAGLLGEVSGLLPFRSLPILQKTVGYQELFPVCDGESSADAAVALVQQHTRQYAKRQLTWFRRDKRYMWLDENPLKTVLEKIRESQIE